MLSTGGAGTVGLARFVTQRRGKADSLLVAGSSVVGSAIASKSPVSLKDVVPVARLTEEAAVIVVPAEGPAPELLLLLLLALLLEPTWTTQGGTMIFERLLLDGSSSWFCG